MRAELLESRVVCPHTGLLACKGTRTTLLTCYVCIGCHTAAGAGLGIGQRRHRRRRGGCPRGSRVWPAAACACRQSIRLSHDFTRRGQARVPHMAVGSMTTLSVPAEVLQYAQGSPAQMLQGRASVVAMPTAEQRGKCLTVRLAVLKARHEVYLADCLHSHLRHGGCRHRASACGRAHPLPAPSCFRLNGGSTDSASAG